MTKITIERNDSSQRLDRFLKKYLRNASLSYIYKAIRKDIKVNGKRAKEDTILEEGDELAFYVSEDELARLTARKREVKAKRQFGIVYEDDNLIIVSKPFGLLTHGDQHEKKNTLANQVVDYLIETCAYVPRLEKTFVPSPVNRLDRNTTGLVIFGKNSAALRALTAMIRERGCISKYYLTIVAGHMNKTLHMTDKMIKDHDNNKVMVISREAQEGKFMETIARPVTVNNGYTLVEVEILTGRTHQIRAHLSKEGFPLIGDGKYGSGKANAPIRKRFHLSTQLLHAYKLTFNDCVEPLMYLNGKEFKTEIPDNFREIKDELFDKKTRRQDNVPKS